MIERLRQKRSEGLFSPKDEDISKSLKKTWAHEDAEIALETDRTPRRNHIPETLRCKWREEDREKAMLDE